MQWGTQTRNQPAIHEHQSFATWRSRLALKTFPAAGAAVGSCLLGAGSSEWWWESVLWQSRWNRFFRFWGLERRQIMQELAKTKPMCCAWRREEVCRTLPHNNEGHLGCLWPLSLDLFISAAKILSLASSPPSNKPVEKNSAKLPARYPWLALVVPWVLRSENKKLVKRKLQSTPDFLPWDYLTLSSILMRN